MAAKIEIEIFTPEDCYDQMIHEYVEGPVKGTTTYNDELDNAWTWRPGEYNIWTGYANEGKAHHLDTDIPTVSGIKKFKDLTLNDQVFDENGKICNIVAFSPIFKNRNCYKITFSDNTEVIVDENHEWLVDDLQSRASYQRQCKRSNETKKRGNDQRDKTLKPFILETKNLLRDLKKGTKLNYSVKVCNPVEGHNRELIIPPYVLGAWLGDGSSNGGSIASENREIPDNIKDLGFTITERVNPYSYGVLKLTTLLKKINVIKNKHIPTEYLTASFESRLELLKGLMDTDGYTDSLGRCEYCTVLPKLAEDICYLLSSLGIKAYCKESKSKLYGVEKKNRFRINFKTTLPVFKLKRKADLHSKAKPPKSDFRMIKSVEYVGKHNTQCIEVDSPNHMYLCTKSFIPTHNSLMLKQLCLIKALEENKRFLFSSPEDMPVAEFFADMIHTLSGKSTDKERDNYISRELYEYCYNLIKDKFIFLNIKPPFNTIEKTLSEFRLLIEEYDNVLGCILDPILKFTPSKEAPERDDKFAAHIGMLATQFAIDTMTSVHLVMHQLTPKLNAAGLYEKPNMYAVKSGGSWADGVSNMLFVQRPNYSKDKFDTKVLMGSQKIKKQKLVGVPQDIELTFDRKTNRYKTMSGRDMFNFNKFLPKNHKF